MGCLFCFVSVFSFHLCKESVNCGTISVFTCIVGVVVLWTTKLSNIVFLLFSKYLDKIIAQQTAIT
jgi:hypothetical protein